MDVDGWLAFVPYASAAINLCLWRFVRLFVCSRGSLLFVGHASAAIKSRLFVCSLGAQCLWRFVLLFSWFATVCWSCLGCGITELPDAPAGRLYGVILTPDS
jgi:hypothetical protein